MTTNISDDFIGQRQRRIAAMHELRKLGIDTYTPYAKKDHQNNVIKDNFEKYSGQEVTLTGRLMAKREHGKLIFGDIQDQSGSIQIGIKKDEIQEDLKNSFIGWDNLKLIDTGDFIQIAGTVGKTQQGEITLFVKQLKLLTKSLRPLPVQFEEKEQQFRRRYIDLTINPERKKLFERKAKFWDVSREFMKKNGFIEVETPILEHVTGGADANPFTTHHDALDQDFFLRISTELYQKRLIGAGFEKIYTLAPNFRNEGLSDEHLQEYYQLEWYWAYANYKDGMELMKNMFREIAKSVYGKTNFSTRGHAFDLADDWKEIDYTTAIKEKFDIDIFTDSDEKMLEVLKKQGIDLPGAINRNRIIDNLWKIIRKDVSGPAFLVNQPMFLSPLAKSIPDRPELTQRFQIIIAGSELGNGYSEINDPIDQLERFLEQQKLRDSGDAEAQMLDIDFVEMLEYGMPPTCGYGHSERVFWFLEDITAREGTLFPQMRSDVEELTKKIYADKVDFPEKKQTIISDEKRIDLSAVPDINLVSIDQEVKDKFPGIKTGYIVLENVKVEPTSDNIKAFKKIIANNVKNKFGDKSNVKNSERLMGFQEIYKGFGVDPRKRLNSAEALIRRLVDGNGFYTINNVVDTYNITSAEFELPMAAYDLDAIKGNIVLRFAKEGDHMTKILETDPTTVKSGELVYADAEGVTCLDFNYRDSDRTKITPNAKKIIVFVDGHKDISENVIKDALSVLGGRLEQFTGSKVTGKNIIG